MGLIYHVKEETNRRRGICAKALNKALNERRKCFTWIPKKIVRKKKGKKKSITFSFFFVIFLFDTVLKYVPKKIL